MFNTWNIFNSLVEGIQILDFELQYLYVNNSWAVLCNTSKEELLGKSIATTFPKISETDFFAELQSCIRDRVSKQMKVQFPLLEGPKTLNLNIEQIQEGILIISVEKKEPRLKKNEHFQNELKELLEYKFALDESAIVAITNSKGVIKHANKNFCQISKYSRDELIGQDHRIINSGFHSKEFIRDVWDTISSGEIWKGEFKNKAKDGSYYWVDTTIVPFLDENKKPYQYLAIRADITQRKIAQESHFRIEKRLKESQEIAKLGNWEINFSSGIVQLSEEVCRIFGIEITESQLNYSDWLSYIHPDDLEYVLAINEEARTNASDVELQHRIVLKSGVLKHVYSK